MNGKLTRWLGLGALVCAAVLLPVAGQAEVLHGTGAVHARGSGIASLQGTGKTMIAGHGVLVINDYYGDALVEVEGDGRRVELPNGAVAYFGFKGKAKISGPTYRVTLSGAHVHLIAAGHGRVRLEGCGHVRIRDNLHPWHSDGTDIELAE